MKKLLALLAIAGFVACNSGENKEAKAASTQTTAPAAMDTTKKDSSMAPMSMDTAKKAMDTTKKKQFSLC
jgi:hypothetical protein